MDSQHRHSALINNLKTANARRAHNRFAEHLAPFYKKRCNAGDRSVYVKAEGTEEHARKAIAKTKAKSPA